MVMYIGGQKISPIIKVEAEVNNQDKTITENGVYTADSGYTGLGEVTVNVPSSGLGIPREVNDQGRYGYPTNNFTFSLPNSAIDINSYGMFHAFDKCTSLTSVDLSSLTKITTSSAMQYAFQNCTGLTSVNLSNLTSIYSGGNIMYYAFNGCTSLTSVNLSSLTSVSGSYGMYGTFYGCTSLTSIDLSNLTTINNGNAMQYTFQNCTGLTSVDLSGLTELSSYYGMSSAFYGCTSLASVDLSSLSTLSGNYAMSSTFRNCTQLVSLSFPSLTSTSFGSYTTQFNNMLSGVTGCTVHFPSNLQSVIGSWGSVTAGFGGTNTTVLFDLPATT